MLTSDIDWELPRMQDKRSAEERSTAETFGLSPLSRNSGEYLPLLWQQVRRHRVTGTGRGFHSAAMLPSETSGNST